MIFLEENKNTITYDENWQNISEPEYITATDNARDMEYEKDDIPEPERKRKKSGSKPLLISIQLVLCLLTAAAAFVIKGIGGDLYKNVRQAYYEELNRTLVFDGRHNFDPGSLFGKASADEA